jgi:hypothetical protein
VLIVTIPWALWRALVTKKHPLPADRPAVEEHARRVSIASRRPRLYRVKDTHFQQTFWQRMVGIGDIG